MLAKAIRNRPINQTDPDHFRARVNYICGKATQVALINLAGDWPDAKKQMTAAASLSPRLRYPAYHLVLSWAETENPTDAEMIMAAKAVLNDIGAAEYQCVLATHRDRIDPHVHVVLNRAHPIGGQTLSVSHDYARLEAACRRVEYQMGWPQDRGRFDVHVDGDEVLLVPKPAQHWLRRAEVRAAGRRMEGQSLRYEQRRSGRPSLRQSLTEKAVAWLRGAFAQATAWAEAHKACRRIGLRYVRHGAGARILRPVDGAHMPAGQLGTYFSYAKMTARLGPFHDAVEEQRDDAVHNTMAMTAGVGVPPLPHDPNALGRASREDKQRALEDLRATLEQQRRQVTAALRSRRTMAAQAVRLVLQDRERMARDMHRHRLRVVKIAMHDGLTASPPTGPQTRIEISGWQDATHDHTSARQAWILAATCHKDGHDIWFADMLTANPNTMRITRGQRGLLAHRDRRGNLVGVQQVDSATGRDFGIAAGGRAALCALGPESARNYVVTPDARLAILAAHALRDKARIWVVNPAALRLDEVDYLKEALLGRKTRFLHSPGSDANDVAALSQMFPDMSVIGIADSFPVDQAESIQYPDGP